MIYAKSFTEVKFDKHDIIIIIPFFSNLHRNIFNNRLSCVYISNLTSGKKYVLGQYHNDLINVNLSEIEKIDWPEKTYCYDHIFKNTFIDAKLLYWLKFNTEFKLDLTNKIKKYVYWYKNVKNVGDIVPIVLIFEYFKAIENKIQKNILKIEINSVYYKYKDILNTFHKINFNKFRVNSKKVKEHFGLNRTHINCNYNLFSMTGRPSNTSDGINLAALNKKTNVREIIDTVDNEILLEFDYNSFHVRLISNLIDYKLPNTNLHEYFGRMYFNSPFLTEEQYEKSKHISFRLLYGYSNEYDIEFFNKVYQFRNELWKEFNNKGFIEMPISKRKIQKKNFDKITKNKLFNYLLQGYETEFNYLQLKKIQNYLYTKKSEMILYTYDSFLFRYNKDDGKNLYNDILNILNTHQMNVSVKIGNNYNLMKERTL